MARTPRRLAPRRALAALAMLGGAASALAQQTAGPAGAGATAESAYPIQRLVRYSFTLRNETGQVIEHPALSVYAPVRLTSTQRAGELRSSLPAQVTVDAWGNQVLRVEVGSLPPYASRVLTIDAQLSLSDTPRKVEAEHSTLRAFRQAERYIEADDAQIKQIARTLKSSDALETAQRTYHFVRQRLSRTGFTPEDRGALRTLADKAGDCTEHAYLLAALLRANGIPARVMGGYLMAESGLLRAEDYHNWTEFHVDGVWRLADAHQGNFGRNTARYVTTRVMSAAGAATAAHRYAAQGAGLKVTMN